MNKRTMLVAACLLAAAGASAQQAVAPAPAQQPPQQQDNQSPSMGERTGTDSLLNITPSTQEFVKDVAASDMFEIAAGRLAADRGNAQSKSFAHRMVQDHQKTTAELKELVQSKNPGVTLPPELDAPHQRKLHKMKELKGEDFDKRYGQEQIDAHKEAVSLFERYAKGGDNPALKEWAARTLPALKEHLQMAQGLLR